MNFRVARTRQELEQAYRLVYLQYLNHGFVRENPSGIKVTLHNALPQAATFIGASDTGEVAITATVVPDSPLGLPMDTIYGAELERLRGDNGRLCEVIMLASENSSLTLPFFKVLLDYAKNIAGSDFMCVAVNPRYSHAYERILFQDIGGLKSYHSVNGASAIAKYLDVHYVEEGFSKPGKESLYEIFVSRRTSIDKFTRKFMFGPQDLQYFFVEKSDTFKTAHPENLEYVNSCYKRLRERSSLTI